LIPEVINQREQRFRIYAGATGAVDLQNKVSREGAATGTGLSSELPIGTSGIPEWFPLRACQQKGSMMTNYVVDLVTKLLN